MGSGEINDAVAVGDGAEAFGGCLRVPGAGDRHKSHKRTRLTNHGVGVGQSNTAVVGHR